MVEDETKCETETLDEGADILEELRRNGHGIRLRTGRTDRAECGPPIVNEETVARLDQEATSEEIDRMQKLQVLAVSNPALGEEATTSEYYVSLR